LGAKDQPYGWSFVLADQMVPFIIKIEVHIGDQEGHNHYVNKPVGLWSRDGHGPDGKV
jgi:hypothetical protein